MAKTTEEIKQDIELQKAAGQSGAFYSQPTGDYNTKAYDENNNVIYVKPGEYVRGASLEPKKTSIGSKVAAGDPNAGLDKGIADYYKNNNPKEANGDVKFSEDQQNIINQAKAYSNMNNALMPSNTQMPTAPNLVKLNEDLRSGVAGNGMYETNSLERQLNDTQKTIDDEMMRLRTNLGYEENQPIPVGVISGRNNEATRVWQKNMAVLNDQMSRIQNQLNQRNTAIQNYMNYTQQDYQNALSSYNTEYNKAKTALEYSLGVESAKAKAMSEAQKEAQTQFNTFMNLFKDGQMKYADLDDNMKTQIAAIELASGYPIGTFEALQNANPNKKMLFQSTDDNGRVTVVFQDTNTGELTTQTFNGIGKKSKSSGSGTGATGSTSGYQETLNILNNSKGDDGYVNTDVYKSEREKWGATKNHNVDDFDLSFSHLLNPEDPTARAFINAKVSADEYASLVDWYKNGEDYNGLLSGAEKYGISKETFNKFIKDYKIDKED